MFISRIKLYNWKNFREVDIQLAERVFIVGANATGKSNFLDAIRFLRDISKQSGGLQYAFNIARGGMKKIRYINARKATNVNIEVHLSDSQNKKLKWIYSLDLKHTGGGVFKNEVAVKYEKVWSADKNEYVLDRSEGSSGEDEETKKFTHLEQVTANKEFREIASFCSEIQYLNIVPLLIRESESLILSKDKEDFYGRNLLERVSKLNEKTKNSYFRKINDVLQLAIPQFENITPIKDSNGIPHLQANYKHWRPRGNKQQEDQFSDGTLRLIGFLWALLDGTEPVLLEEPEINLHTEIIKQLPEFIAKIQKRKSGKRQVIITTHSYDLLDTKTISPDEILLLEQGKEGTTIKKPYDIKTVIQAIEAGFSIAEATIPHTKPQNIENITQLKMFE